MRIKKESQLKVGDIIKIVFEDQEANIYSKVKPKVSTLKVLEVYPHHVRFQKMDYPGECKISIHNVDLTFKYGIYNAREDIVGNYSIAENEEVEK